MPVVEQQKHRVPSGDQVVYENNGINGVVDQAGGPGAEKGNSTPAKEGGVAGQQEGKELDALLPSVHCDESYPIDGEYDKKVRRTGRQCPRWLQVPSAEGLLVLQVEELAEVLNDLLPSEAMQPHQDGGQDDPRQVQDRQMAQVVISLRRLDRILERLETFWARCEVDLQLMIQRGDHLKCLTAFAQTPQTIRRLHDRLQEYRFFWCRVKDACTRCGHICTTRLTPLLVSFSFPGSCSTPGRLTS